MRKALNESLLVIIVFIIFFNINHVIAQRQMETLDRGVIAINQGSGKVYIGWRLFAKDSADIAFNVYRTTGSSSPIKVNSSVITKTTDFINTGVDISKSNTYFVKPVFNNMEQEASAAFTLPANAPVQQYLSIPLRDGGALYSQSCVGDIDGDGQYEIIVKWSKSLGVDPGSHTTGTAKVYIDAYKLNGTFLWRIDLGWNLEPGSDFTPMLVYDIDGDGKAEIITKSAEGTIDGTGTIIGDTNGDGITDYRNTDGRVIRGPEFMSIYRGIDGKELVRTNWITRGNVSDWGDSSGNRSCRFQIVIAYLDGIRPSIVMCRGVYAYQVVEAWNFRDNSLSKVWSWDNGGKGQSGEWHSSNQCLRMGDVDGDGKDEILKGPLVIDENGTTLWDLNLIKGHGDYLSVGVLDPSKGGLQIFKILEAGQANGVAMLDAKTGTVLWGKTTAGDAGRGYCAHIDPRYNGVQCWAGQNNNDLLNYDGTVITAGNAPSKGDHWAPIWWEGGLVRSITDEFSGTDGVHILRWEYATSTLSEIMKTGTGTRNTQVIADILGDWREELVLFLPNEIRVYNTTIPSTTKLYTLMQNPLYRLNVGQTAQRNWGPALPDYYLGTGMTTPPTPNIKLKNFQNIALSIPTDKKYGDTPFIISSKSGKSGNPVHLTVVSGDGATISDSTISISKAGSVKIRATQAGDDNYYEALAVENTLNIAKAPLTVTATDTFRYKMEENPKFILNYSGFVYNDNVEKLDIKPVATTLADSLSAIGVYSIVVSGGIDKNYYFNYVNGELKVLENVSSVPDLLKYEVSIFPNPSSGNLIIKYGETAQKINIVIESITGVKLLESSAYATATITVNLSNLSIGTYILKTTIDNKTKVSKIIKK